MLTQEKIILCLNDLNDELRKVSIKGEICIIGGAVMCIVFNTRAATRDVDGIFEPSQSIRDAAAKVAKKRKLSSDWLNDAAKGYLVSGFQKINVLTLSNLVVWAPEPRYMLAMKCISARWDTHDREDVIFLIKHLAINTAQEVFNIIQGFYAKFKIPAKTQFFIEELLDVK